MRRALVAAVVAAAAVVVGGGSAARTDETVFVPAGFPIKPVTTRTSVPPRKPLTLELTGSYSVKDLPPASPRTMRFDGLYCFEGCVGGDVVPAYNLVFSSEKDPGAGEHSFRDRLLSRDIPRYNPSHRYRFTLSDRIEGYGHLRFRILVPEPRPAAGFKYGYAGGIKVEIVGPFTEEEAEPVRVNFFVRASGKPNLPLRGYSSPRTLVTSRVFGSGHATFTKKNAAVLIATETKGSIVHEDVYADGTTHRLEFGIVSGTRYSPAGRRLALVLKLKDSNDPDCEAGVFFSTTFGVLTLIPHEDVGLHGGSVIFFGLPKTNLTSSCRHAHAWETSPREHVAARVLVAEVKP
jgi:hypothetical protein